MKTSIQWTDYSWNPVTGCTPVSPGCAHCYARRMAKRLAGRAGYPEAPHEFDVALQPNRLEEPLRWKKPHMVFVCSMSDLFHEDVPFGFIKDVFRVMHSAKTHTFQILTKRPERMLEFFNWGEGYFTWATDNILTNVWLGVTVENQEQANKRIPVLLQIPAAVRFVSVEPMLGHVDISPYLPHEVDSGGFDPQGYPINITNPGIDWVICGGESGPDARPMNPEWARALRDQCQKANVPFFFKQFGTWIPNYEFDQSGEESADNLWYNTLYSSRMRVGKDKDGYLDGKQHHEFPKGV